MSKTTAWTVVAVVAMVVALLAYIVHATGTTEGFADVGPTIGAVLTGLLGSRR